MAPDVEGPATDAQIDLQPEQAEAPLEEEPVADFDPDVASIFTEEATELLEVCESQLAAWRAATLESPSPRGAEAPAAYAQGRCPHGGHHRDGRFEP